MLCFMILFQQLYSKTLGGIKLGKRLVHFLLYGDDLVIVAQNKETLQHKINVLASFLNQCARKLTSIKQKLLFLENQKGLESLIASNGDHHL